MSFFFDIEWVVFLPEIFLIFVVNFLLIYGVFFSLSFKHNFPILTKNFSWLTIQSFLFVLILILNNFFQNVIFFNNFLIVDFLSTFTKCIVLIFNIFFLIISLFYNEISKINNFEFFVLNIFGCIGIFFLVSSYDFIGLFLSIELQSFCFYILCSFKRKSEFSVEAGLKYFILGAFSGGFFLFGCSFLYAFIGTTCLAKIFFFLNTLSFNFLIFDIGIFVGLMFILIGLMFKLSVAPFHIWLVDIFEGSPFSITSFFAFVPKIAIFSVFVRIILFICYPFFVFWQELILFSSVLSIWIGIFGALYQKKIKRFLAYSSISHFGFIFLGVCTNCLEGVFACFLYIIIYIVTLLIFFGILLSVRLVKKNNQIKYLSDLSAFFYLNSYFSISFFIIFFSMSGIPPFAGFFSKFFIFFVVINSDLTFIGLFSILLSGLACFYYIRLIKTIFFEKLCLNHIFFKFKKENALIISFFSIFLTFFLFFSNFLIIILYNVIVDFFL